MRILSVIPFLLFLTSFTELNFDPDGLIFLNRFQTDFLTRVNQVRTTGCTCGKTFMPPVQPLRWNALLELSADRHARDMHRRNYFAHTSLSGKKIKNRIEDAGYSLSGMRAYAFGENIASGQRSIDQVMTRWLRSEGHCKNIMNENFTEIGVAEFNSIWVQEFGMRLKWN